MTLTDAAKPSRMAIPPINEEMLELYEPVVESLSEYSGAICDGCAAMGTEWLNFVNKRLHADLSLPVRLAKCSSPQDLFQEWATFMSATAVDYRNEFVRLADLNSAATQRALTAVKTHGATRGNGTQRRP